METRYAKLKPLSFAAGFAAAAVVEIILFLLPMAVMHHQMMGPGSGMMVPATDMMRGGNGMGLGIMLLMALWIVVVSAIAGAVVAAVYNALVTTKVP